MRLLGALLSSVFCQAVSAADGLPLYVVDIRHNGDAVLHVGTKDVPPKVELPFVVVDMPVMACCFRLGPKAPGRKMIKIDEDAPPLTSEEGEETFQFAGHVTTPSLATPHHAVDSLAFGIEGMTSMQPKGRRTYEIVLAHYAKPVIVRHCLGVEGVNFRLYHALADKKPFATYYLALGYDVKADCR